MRAMNGRVIRWRKPNVPCCLISYNIYMIGMLSVIEKLCLRAYGDNRAFKQVESTKNVSCHCRFTLLCRSLRNDRLHALENSKPSQLTIPVFIIKKVISSYFMRSQSKCPLSHIHSNHHNSRFPVLISYYFMDRSIQVFQETENKIW